MAARKKPRNPRKGQDERGIETERKSLALRIDGLTFAAIGLRLGMSMRGAHEAVTRALAKSTSAAMKSADDLRTLELERLDLLQRSLLPKAKRGNAESARALLRVMERRAKLLGLDAPTEVKLGLAEFLATVFDAEPTNETSAGDDIARALASGPGEVR